ELEGILGWACPARAGWESPAKAGHYIEAAVQRHIFTAAAWHQHAAALGLEPVALDRFWPLAGVAVYRAMRDIFLAWPSGPAAQGEAARAALLDSFAGISTIADADAARTVARLWLGFFH